MSVANPVSAVNFGARQAKPQDTAEIVFGDAHLLIEAKMIGPDEASTLLKANTSNRPLTRSNVVALASAMTRGEWVLNGETIIFSPDGTLMQGQHRLHAIIKSGVTVPLLLVRGIQFDAFSTLDLGRKRSVGDVLNIHGEVNANVLASALRSIGLIEGIVTDQRAMSPAMATSILDRHPSVRVWTSRFSSSEAKKFISSAFIGALTMAAERHGSERVAEFFAQVSSGEGLHKGMPAYAVRERFFARSRTDVIPYMMALAYAIKALNAHLTGQPMKMLRWAADEQMPKLV